MKIIIYNLGTLHFFNRGDADLSTLFWEKLGTGLDVGLKDKVPWHLFQSWSKLKMQVVWVTGASTGIGAALAMEAVKHGAKVAITARSLPRSKCFLAVQNSSIGDLVTEWVTEWVSEWVTFWFWNIRQAIGWNLWPAIMNKIFKTIYWLKFAPPPLKKICPPSPKKKLAPPQKKN